jgi:shikimate kinase/3-dehydroquinate synthase
MKSNIFIYGPPGVGKSSCGTLLAEALGLSFLDLDEQIQQDCRLPIPQIFAEQGEANFRQMESQALNAAASGKDRVIALGGGALLNPENLTLVEQNGEVVCLTAPVETLHSHLAGDDNQRPLLQNDNLANLMDQRQAHYASFTNQINTDHLSPVNIAEEIQSTLGWFRISGMGKEYLVRIEEHGLEELGGFLQALGLKGPFALVSDENVAQYYAKTVKQSLENAGLQAATIVIPAGETHKTMAVVNTIWEQLLAAGMERSSTLVSLGGGVVNDLAGFAAATYMRGMDWVTLPTSLLCMVDASMGGKTGANLPAGKNLVGAFHPPRLVLADPGVLSTLPHVEVTSGLAEVVKHGVISDPRLFEICAGGLKNVSKQWDTVIKRGMAVKVRVIQEDPYEQGRRAALNLGHTIGHAVEALSGYTIRHGEGVAIGMVAEARLAEKLGIASNGLAEQIASVLTKLELPTEIPNDMPRQKLVEIMQHDKKRKGGSVRFALPAEIGNVQTGIVIENLTQLMAEI